MAYQTYISEALVCGSRESNTSDKVFLLFTREAGMVFAHVKSIREEKSKHRYSLQQFAHLRVTLVKGKNGWKITGSEPIHNFFSNAESREARAFLRKLFIFLRRVMQGETAHQEIFDDVLEKIKNLSEYKLKELETILFLRVLHELGYVAPDSKHNVFLKDEVTPELINSTPDDVLKKCAKIVEYALTQSQL